MALGVHIRTELVKMDLSNIINQERKRTEAIEARKGTIFQTRDGATEKNLSASSAPEN